MPNLTRHLATTITLVGLAAFCPAQQVPATNAKALDKSEVIFPRSESGKTILLVVSFSHKGEKQCDRWNEKLKPLYLTEPRVAYYELADFQGVPSFVMRMVMHGLRRKLPKDEWSHFVPFYRDEDAWKKLTGYAAPQDAYVLAAAPDGHVLWQTHGATTDSAFTELQSVISRQIAKP